MCIQFPSQLPVLEERKVRPRSPHRVWTRGNSHNHEETLVSRALHFPRWTDWLLSLVAFCFSGGYHCKPFSLQHLTSPLLYSLPPSAARPHPLPCPSRPRATEMPTKDQHKQILLLPAKWRMVGVRVKLIVKTRFICVICRLRASHLLLA